MYTHGSGHREKTINTLPLPRSQHCGLKRAEKKSRIFVFGAVTDVYIMKTSENTARRNELHRIDNYY